MIGHCVSSDQCIRLRFRLTFLRSRWFLARSVIKKCRTKPIFCERLSFPCPLQTKSHNRLPLKELHRLQARRRPCRVKNALSREPIKLTNNHAMKSIRSERSACELQLHPGFVREAEDAPRDSDEGLLGFADGAEVGSTTVLVDGNHGEDAVVPCSHHPIAIRRYASCWVRHDSSLFLHSASCGPIGLPQAAGSPIFAMSV